MRNSLIILIATVIMCGVAKADTATVALGSASYDTTANEFTATTVGALPAGMGQFEGTNEMVNLVVTIDFNAITHSIVSGGLMVGTTSSNNVFNSTTPVSFSYNDAGDNTAPPPSSYAVQYINFSFVESTNTAYASTGEVVTGDVEFQPKAASTPIPSDFFSSWSINQSESNADFKADVNVSPLPATSVSVASLLAGLGVLCTHRRITARNRASV
jgi:hypothetical protein